MIQEPRLRLGQLAVGWILCLATFGCALYFFGPSPSRIALLSVTDGMTVTFGSIYALGAAAAIFLTLALAQLAIGGLESFFELESTPQIANRSQIGVAARAAVIGAYALISLLTCYFLFVRLNRSLLCAMPHDSFIFFDGTMRLASGQIPHIDFHTPMGIFCNLIPYLGFKAAHGFAGSVEWGSLFAGAVLVGIGVLVTSSRMSIAAAVPFLFYICLLAVVPLGEESTPAGVTHAMFFNRLGWVSITLVFLFFLEPRFPSKSVLAIDSVCLGFLLFFLFYLKLSYFMVGAAFLPLLFISSRYNRRLAFFSFCLLAVGIGVIEVLYGLNGPYLRDVLMAIHASGANRGSMIPKFVANIKEFALVAGAFALAWESNRSNWLYYVFIGFVACAGLAIIDQNTQALGVICLLSALLVSQELIRRSINTAATSNDSARLQRFKSLACLGLIVLFVIQPIIFRSTTMMMIRSAVAQFEPEMPGNLQGMIFSEQLWKHFCSGKIREPLTGKVVPPAMKEKVSYLDTVLEGVKALDGAVTTGKHVMVFDFVTPFSMILAMEPAKGGHTAIDYSRTMNESDCTSPEELLGLVDYVMVPRLPLIPATTQFLLQTYGPYLESHFEKSKETENWVLWSRRPLPSN